MPRCGGLLYIGETCRACVAPASFTDVTDQALRTMLDLLCNRPGSTDFWSRYTLLMLVSAFAGFDNIRQAYRHAITQRYRFFSYGDAMLLTRTQNAEI